MNHPNELSSAICRAVGLDPDEVTSLAYEHVAGDPAAMITVTYAVVRSDLEEEGDASSLESLACSFKVTPVVDADVLERPPTLGR